MFYFRPTLNEITGKKGLLFVFFVMIFLVLERGEQEQDYVGFWYKSLAKCYFDNISGLRQRIKGRATTSLNPISTR